MKPSSISSLSNSYYLSQKPHFWGSGTWPSSGYPNTPRSLHNPAYTRFANNETKASRSGVPLAVEWTSFTLEQVKETVALQCTIAQEVNNDRFEVEYSFDGWKFNKIGTVKGNGNST